MSFLHLFHEPPAAISIAPLAPLRRWLSTLEISNVYVAQWICRLVPNTCSEGYDLRLLGRTWLHFPPFCKLNPFADELLELRFRAADFLYEYSCD